MTTSVVTVGDGGEMTLWTHGGEAQITVGREGFEPTLDDLGKIAEWLAAAWENLAGEKYTPVIITERGCVADEGYVTVRARIPASALPPQDIESYSAVERDCE